MLRSKPRQMSRHQEHWMKTPVWNPEMPPEIKLEEAKKENIILKICKAAISEIRKIDDGF
jgi:hypothetical protein